MKTAWANAGRMVFIIAPIRKFLTCMYHNFRNWRHCRAIQCSYSMFNNYVTRNPSFTFMKSTMAITQKRPNSTCIPKYQQNIMCVLITHLLCMMHQLGEFKLLRADQMHLNSHLIHKETHLSMFSENCMSLDTS